MSRATVDRSMSAAYNLFSNNQLMAHVMTYPALRAAAGRVLRLTPRDRPATLHIADLGCAGGANSMVLLREVQAAVNAAKSEHGDAWQNLHTVVHFEDLPTNDWNVLSRLLVEPEQTAFFEANNIHPTMVPKGFYSPVVPPGSLHLALSYITLHWLNAATLDEDAAAAFQTAADGTTAWLNPQEHGGCPDALAAWRAVADADLTTFLRLRAAELVPGGEGVFVMVGGARGDGVPRNDWVTTSRDPRTGAPTGGLFTHAIRRAVAAGEVRGVAARTCIPYFARNEVDVRRAFAAVAESLELVELDFREVAVGEPVDAGAPGQDSLGAEMAYTIHRNCIQSSGGFSDEEMAAIKRHMMDVYREWFPSGVCNIAYMYMVVRRRM